MGRMIRPVFGAAFLLAASLLAQAAPPPAPPGKTANAELDARRLQGRAYYENEQYA
jgi:hypothetical protein